MLIYPDDEGFAAFGFPAFGVPALAWVASARPIAVPRVVMSVGVNALDPGVPVPGAFVPVPGDWGTVDEEGKTVVPMSSKHAGLNDSSAVELKWKESMDRNTLMLSSLFFLVRTSDFRISLEFRQ